MQTLTGVSKNGTSMVLATSLETAKGFAARSKGLLGRRELPAGEGLWIQRCNSIHTFFMRFAIDAIFVDGDFKVVATHENLKPWRLTRLHVRASSVFELPSGTLRGAITIGDQLALTSTSGGARG